MHTKVNMKWKLIYKPVHTNTHIMKLRYLAAKPKDEKTGKQIT